MGQYKNITDEQLIEFSGEHLFYEIKMLYGIVDLLSQEKKLYDFYIYNALLEAAVIHTQIIIDFFYMPQMKADDAKAIHYIKDVKRWKSALPSYDRYFRKFNRRRSREVVHLSYSRLDIKGEDKPWYLLKTTTHIKRVVNKFLEHADKERLHPKMFEFKTAI